MIIKAKSCLVHQYNVVHSMDVYSKHLHQAIKVK